MLNRRLNKLSWREIKKLLGASWWLWNLQEHSFEAPIDTNGGQDLPSVCAPMMAAVSLPLKLNWSRKKSSVASPLPCRYRYYWIDIVDIVLILDISVHPPLGWGVSRACPSCTAPTCHRTRTRSQRAQTGTGSPGAKPPAVSSYHHLDTTFNKDDFSHRGCKLGIFRSFSLVFVLIP